MKETETITLRQLLNSGVTLEQYKFWKNRGLIKVIKRGYRGLTPTLIDVNSPFLKGKEINRI